MIRCESPTAADASPPSGCGDVLDCLAFETTHLLFYVKGRNMARIIDIMPTNCIFAIARARLNITCSCYHRSAAHGIAPSIIAPCLGPLASHHSSSCSRTFGAFSQEECPPCPMVRTVPPPCICTRRNPPGRLIAVHPLPMATEWLFL